MTETNVYESKTVFVTGASGIVGSSLVRELLAQRAAVVALLRDESPNSELMRSGGYRRITCVRGSLEQPDVLERALVEYEVDAIFHLGAQTQVRHAQRHPFGTLEANVRGTYNLLEVVRRLDRPAEALVIASSDKAYGDSEDLPYTEAHPLAGRNIYDASKSAADMLASAYAESYSLPVGIARCGNIYGGGDLNWDRIVPGTIRSLMRGQRPIIRSDGTPSRDYLFVDDAVSAYLLLGASLMRGLEHGEAFNFGHGEPVAVLDLVSEIIEVVGRHDLPPEILSESPNEIQAQWLDASKAKSRLRWTPAFTLRSGLGRTVEWYLELLR